MSVESKKEKQFERAIDITLNATPGALRTLITTRARELKFQGYHYRVFEEEKSATQNFSKFLVMTIWKERPEAFTDDLIGVFTLELVRGNRTLFHVPPSHAWAFETEQEGLRDRGRSPGWIGIRDFNQFGDGTPFIAFLKLLCDELQRAGLISLRAAADGKEMDVPTVMQLIEIAAYVEVPYLKTLHRDNDEFPLWKAKMQDILKVAFGEKSDEYGDFLTAVLSYKYAGTEETFQQQYVDHLTKYQIALKKIMQRDTLVGIKRKTAATTAPSRYQLTSPVYWVECIWNWLKTHRRQLWRWFYEIRETVKAFKPW